LVTDKLHIALIIGLDFLVYDADVSISFLHGEIRDGPGASGYPFGFGYPLTFSAKSDIRIRWRIPADAGGYPRISAPEMTPRVQIESSLGKYQILGAA
jgi:hypothetical protein